RISLCLHLDRSDLPSPTCARCDIQPVPGPSRTCRTALTLSYTNGKSSTLVSVDKVPTSNVVPLNLSDYRCRLQDHCHLSLKPLLVLPGITYRVIHSRCSRSCRMGLRSQTCFHDKKGHILRPSGG